MRTPVSVGVVCNGSGRGAGLARAFDALPQATLRWVCEEGPRATSVGYGPATAWTTDFDELLQDEDLDAIAFASGELAARGRSLAALAADKHVLVDGELASTSAEADELLAAAARQHRRVMSHTPALLRPGVLRLRRLIERRALGDVFYVHAQHHVLCSDAGVDLLRDVAAETVAVALDLLGDEPVEVFAQAESYLAREQPDVIFAKLSFATGIDVHLHFSCLEGEHADRVTVVGSEATAVLDGAAPDHELSLRVTGSNPDVFNDLALEQGGTIAFRLPADDPLLSGCMRFISAVRTRGDVPYSREASAVLAVLEALERSCVGRGSTETIAPRPGAPAENVVAFRALSST